MKSIQERTVKSAPLLTENTPPRRRRRRGPGGLQRGWGHCWSLSAKKKHTGDRCDILHFMEFNILTSRKAIHFTEKNYLDNLSARTIEKRQNKQTLKKGLFQTGYIGFQIQVSIELHLCDTLLLDSTPAMTLQKWFTENPSQTQSHPGGPSDCSPASQGTSRFPTSSQTQSEFSQKVHSGPTMVSLDLCIPAGTREASQGTWQSNQEHR